jgi:diguanylate cyclase (GGDEF)-like protein
MSSKHTTQGEPRPPRSVARRRTAGRRQNARTAARHGELPGSPPANGLAHAGLRTREKALIQNEAAVKQREALVTQREEALIHANSAAHSGLEADHKLVSQMAHLREANQNLVVATVQAQTLTQEVQTAKEVVTHMAQHDALTDLPNRTLFAERLTQAIALAKRHRSQLAVLFMDLDRFKSVNDLYGHAVGDELLRSVAQRMAAAIRGTDTVARVGGDEFLVLLSEVDDEQSVVSIVDTLYKSVCAPYTLGAYTVEIGLSVGISLFPDDGLEADTLLQKADTAMYHAKTAGEDHFYFFKPEMQVRILQRMKLQDDLKQALVKGEFELHYQGQYELQTHRVIGAEALLRWHHPQLGLLHPHEFMEAAQEAGIISTLGRWALRGACMQAQAWLQAGLPLQRMGVNISASDFSSKDFLSCLNSILRDTHLGPEHLELEMTEAVLMRNVPESLAALHAIKETGVHVAVDDFGTGYSNLSHLRQFAIDTLKINPSLVGSLVSNADSDMVVKAMIRMGENMQFQVVALGIERGEQLQFLKAHHCHGGQGFCLNRPMPAPEFAAFMGGSGVV